MGYAIMRCAKMKRGDLCKYDNHHWRKRDKLENRKHAELECKNINKLRDNKTLTQQVRELIKQQEEATKRKVRKDCVVAIEFVFAFSPECEGSFNIEQWAIKNLKWVKEQVGGRLMEFNIEYDETTTHMHAVVAPIINERFNAKKMTDKKFEEWQDTYAEYMQEFNLERGISKKITRRKHKTLREYNEELQEKNKELENKTEQLEKEHEKKMKEYKEQEEKERRRIKEEVFEDKQSIRNYNEKMFEADDLFL